MSRDELVLHVEAALLSAGRPVAIDEFLALFEDWEDAPDRQTIRDAIAALSERWRGHSLEVGEVASGYRAQIRKEYSQSISRLWHERPARYSRALLETLALIAYRQPVSRGEIEEIRGVSVSGSIMKTLIEREWIRVVGHRETPGRPALYGTTRHFLDTFNLKSLAALPPLAELKELEDPRPDLFLGFREDPETGEGQEPPGVAAVPEAQADDAVAVPVAQMDPDGSATAADEPAPHAEVDGSMGPVPEGAVPEGVFPVESEDPPTPAAASEPAVATEDHPGDAPMDTAAGADTHPAEAAMDDTVPVPGSVAVGEGRAG